MELKPPEEQHPHFDSNGLAVIHTMTITKSMSFMVKKLVGKNRSNLELKTRDKYQFTPVLAAFSTGNSETLLILFELGADLRQKDAYDRSAAVIALYFGQDKLLLSEEIIEISPRFDLVISEFNKSLLNFGKLFNFKVKSDLFGFIRAVKSARKFLDGNLSKSIENLEFTNSEQQFLKITERLFLLSNNSDVIELARYEFLLYMHLNFENDHATRMSKSTSSDFVETLIKYVKVNGQVTSSQVKSSSPISKTRVTDQFADVLDKPMKPALKRSMSIVSIVSTNTRITQDDLEEVSKNYSAVNKIVI